MMVLLSREINEKTDFEDALERGLEKLLVFVFTARWCGPCRVISPKVQDIIKENPDVVFYQINVDDNIATSQACGITCVPTFQFFRRCTKIEEFSGANEQKIRDFLAKHKKSS
ncbi:hypothetical protein ACHWQZ_G016393 [Mnemiopsis leidyi]